MAVTTPVSVRPHCADEGDHDNVYLCPDSSATKCSRRWSNQCCHCDTDILQAGREACFVAAAAHSSQTARGESALVDILYRASSCRAIISCCPKLSTPGRHTRRPTRASSRAVVPRKIHDRGVGNETEATTRAREHWSLLQIGEGRTCSAMLGSVIPTQNATCKACCNTSSIGGPTD
jgi:hypothetical protein